MLGPTYVIFSVSLYSKLSGDLERHFRLQVRADFDQELKQIALPLTNFELLTFYHCE